jgi:hypothetical protein
MIYSDSNINNRQFQRVFKHDISNDELVWHRDKNDRIISVVEGSGWKFQIDNHLPFNLIVGERYFIAKETFHRILKGNTDLILDITEI